MTKRTTKDPGGRPSKYRPKFCQTVLDVGDTGGWLCEMAEACGVHRNTMDSWAATHPEFLEALSRAKQKAQAWMERQGRLGLTAPKFNSNLWARQMAARHPDEYSEKRVTELQGRIERPVLPKAIPMEDHERFAKHLNEARENFARMEREKAKTSEDDDLAVFKKYTTLAEKQERLPRTSGAQSPAGTRT